MLQRVVLNRPGLWSAVSAASVFTCRPSSHFPNSFGKFFLKNQNCWIHDMKFETRLPPGSLAASHRGFAFCVADPIGSAHEPAGIDLKPIS
jgi:hypothetical protein